MTVIELSRIIEGERFRKDYGALDELKASIVKFGLLQPIVIDEEYNLLAGGRRLRAHQELALTHIPARFVSELTELQKREIELEENIQRKDLSFVEEAKLTAEIHRLKIELYGQQQAGRPAEGAERGWGIQQTADALDTPKPTIMRQLALAKAIEIIPEVAEAPNYSSAMKVFERRYDALRREYEVRKLKHEEENILCGDSATLLKTIPDQSIDCIITDPPYGVDLSGEHRQGGVHFDDSPENAFAILDACLPEFKRVLKPDGHIYCFFGMAVYEEFKTRFEAAGLIPRPFPLIWVKETAGAGNWDVNFAPGYEPIMFYSAWLRNISQKTKDWFSWPSVPSNERTLGWEKPVAAAIELIELSTRPGEVVLDPFCGSGFVPLAAKQLGRKYIAFDLEPNMINITKLRLAEFVASQEPSDDNDEVGETEADDNAEDDGTGDTDPSRPSKDGTLGDDSDVLDQGRDEE